ncbi:FAD-binding oxidoreductase [Rhodospirillaceae bacterium SYSU D60014]|uniref:FAD-binding oxidoreductase n=1 Tax=Virgifigura deserti TaxID=2268457 RepID=UPI000E66AACD
MTELTLRTLDGQSRPMDDEAIDRLGSQLRGTVVRPQSPEYEEVRQVWNAMIDRRPGLIVQCAGAADVLACVRFARKHRLLTSVRGAGHNIAGSSVCDGGLMIDLTPMKSVRVDPTNRTARVEPGVTLGEFDKEAQAFGLATPLGINSTTGVAGLTLGGGFGWLSRRYGMTIDNLVAADVVTAAGELMHASEQEHPELFWAIRGGGGNFGIVTSFEFRLHAVGPDVLAGLIVHPFEGAGDLLRRYRDFAANSPDDLSCWVVLRKAPPLPFLPPEVHGKEVVVFALCHAGDPAEGQKAIEPLMALGQPVGTHVDIMPYTAWQSAFDPLLTPGARNYWKSHNFTELDDEAIDLTVRYAGQLPTPQCEIFIGQIGGATKRVAADAMAYPHRDADFVMNVHTRWDDPAEDQRCIAWAREFFNAAAPHATGGVYVNFITEDEERVAAAYGGNYDRLADIKRRYDPENLFRLNQNIPGKAAA